MKIYLLKHNDGGVSVMRMQIDDATVENELAKWPDDERAKVASWREIQESDIPADRSQRHAWADITDETKIDIDPVKAEGLK